MSLGNLIVFLKKNASFEHLMNWLNACTLQKSKTTKNKTLKKCLFFPSKKRKRMTNGHKKGGHSLSVDPSHILFV